MKVQLHSDEFFPFYYITDKPQPNRFEDIARKNEEYFKHCAEDIPDDKVAWILGVQEELKRVQTYLTSGVFKNIKTTKSMPPY